jgi:hypothetical protein
VHQVALVGQIEQSINNKQKLFFPFTINPCEFVWLQQYNDYGRDQIPGAPFLVRVESRPLHST